MRRCYESHRRGRRRGLLWLGIDPMCLAVLLRQWLPLLRHHCLRWVTWSIRPRLRHRDTFRSSRRYIEVLSSWVLGQHHQSLLWQGMPLRRYIGFCFNLLLFHRHQKLLHAWYAVGWAQHSYWVDRTLVMIRSHHKTLVDMVQLLLEHCLGWRGY